MLTQYRIVHADGLKAVNYEGKVYPLDKIDDTIAAKLHGRTHVIEKLPTATVAVATADEEPAPKPARNK